MTRYYSGVQLDPPELLPPGAQTTFNYGVLEATTLPTATRYRVFPELEQAERSAVRNLLRERPTTLQLVRIRPVLRIAPEWNTALSSVTGWGWT
ncbi:hypothetical protein FHR75_001280 [Kineococcus radiotolerans]|uniref:Uncharacterized protein n=1 Tax=Kineococcus radiotolerans TaxID=131568 RepID=A0A7W4TL46_KINRA|nr:hypothetical protein [Kineococcus radiotolerans]MBB2900492.1 hypothetical protein [Kineococcus radiotolerans]